MMDLKKAPNKEHRNSKVATTLALICLIGFKESSKQGASKLKILKQNIDLRTNNFYLKKAPNKEHRNFFCFFANLITKSVYLKKAPNKEHRNLSPIIRGC